MEGKLKNIKYKTQVKRQTDRRTESVAIEEIVERCQVSRMQCITTLQWRVWQEEKLEGWGWLKKRQKKSEGEFIRQLATHTHTHAFIYVHRKPASPLSRV